MQANQGPCESTPGLMLTHAHAHTNNCVYYTGETAGVVLNEPVAEPGIGWFCGQVGKQPKQVLS